MTLALIILTSHPLTVDARGKKKKKKAGGASTGGPSCASLGLDCSATCCLENVCADNKLDCAVKFKRPFEELYTGFASIFLITLGVSIVIWAINFCLMYKFCQHFDENLDSKVGGFSICDAISCLLTCGLIYRKKKVKEGPSVDELDFRRRFEKSMDKQSGELGFGEVKKKRVRTHKPKDVQNYLSTMAKSKGNYNYSKGGKGGANNNKSTHATHQTNHTE